MIRDKVKQKRKRPDNRKTLTWARHKDMTAAHTLWSRASQQAANSAPFAGSFGSELGQEWAQSGCMYDQLIGQVCCIVKKGFKREGSYVRCF